MCSISKIKRCLNIFLIRQTLASKEEIWFSSRKISFNLGTQNLHYLTISVGISLEDIQNLFEFLIYYKKHWRLWTIYTIQKLVIFSVIVSVEDWKKVLRPLSTKNKSFDFESTKHLRPPFGRLLTLWNKCMTGRF